jgi:hypothetical protein
LKFQKKTDFTAIFNQTAFYFFTAHNPQQLFFHISQPTAVWLGFLGAFAIVKSQKSTKGYGFVLVTFRKVAFL